MTIHAVYENGVFRPLEDVNLPEQTRVLVIEEPAKRLPDVEEEKLDAVYEVLGRSFDDPASPGDRAERHNEHQP